MRKLFNQSAHEKSKKNEKTGENARTEEQSHGIREALRRAAEVLLIPVCALYMEIISKLRTFGELFQTDIVYMISLAAAMGFLFAAIPLLLPGKHRRRVFTGIMAAMSVLFSFPFQRFEFRLSSMASISSQYADDFIHCICLKYAFGLVIALVYARKAPPYR